MATEFARVEEKLYQNRYIVDAGKPHIYVEPHTTPSQELAGDDQGVSGAAAMRRTILARSRSPPTAASNAERAAFSLEPTGEITWSYPRGGFGVCSSSDEGRRLQ